MLLYTAVEADLINLNLGASLIWFFNFTKVKLILIACYINSNINLLGQNFQLNYSQEVAMRLTPRKKHSSLGYYYYYQFCI